MRTRTRLGYCEWCGEMDQPFAHEFEECDQCLAKQDDGCGEDECDICDEYSTDEQITERKANKEHALTLQYRAQVWAAGDEKGHPPFVSITTQPIKQI